MTRQDNPLNKFDTLDLLQKIESYKKTDLKRIKDDDLFKLTLSTLPVLNIVSTTLIEGTKLYRIRYKQTDELFSNKTDAWYPPAELVRKRQRLNNIGQPMLYTSLDSATPFFESNAKAGDSFAFFEYEVKVAESIQVTSIGMNEELPESMLNRNGRINNKIIEQFLYSEFTKEVADGTEHLYRISNILAMNFYNIPNCGGYMYPSVAIGSGINVALKPEAVDKSLKLNSVTNLTFVDYIDNGIKVDIRSKSSSIDLHGNIIY